ncbi:MAG: universal stress protein, partial [Deltaproteobacteria bacterium]|nr:universal stress protein [Deltaproteobacteria bacterium]
MKKLLVATDLSVASNAALRFAQEQVGARGDEIEIELVTVIEDLSTALVTFEFGVAPLVSDSTYHDLQHAASQRLESLAAEYFPERKARVVAFRGSSSVAQDLAHHARETGADELIVTTHGRSGVAHFLMGSVAEEVVRQGICPTFVVPLREGSQESMRNARGAAPILVLTDFSPESTVVFPYAREQFAACRSRGSE